jgi:hypothetical protein
MSSATTEQGRLFENAFREGFLAQNRKFMVNEAFVYEHEKVFDDRGQILGDIDAAVMLTTELPLKSLLPVRARIGKPEMMIKESALVIFDVTQKPGESVLSKKRGKTSTLSKKLKFIGDQFNDVDETTYYVFIYNGVEHAVMNEEFDRCSKYRLDPDRCTAVWIHRDDILKWAVIKEIEEKDAIIKEKDNIIHAVTHAEGYYNRREGYYNRREG